MAPTVEQLFDLSGRVALVTGGAGFLGQAICAALAEAGARVVVGSRNLERGQEAADQLPNPGRDHLAITLDHKDENSLDSGFATAVEQAGQVDILINNGQGGVGKDWTDIAQDEFAGQLENATGYFLLARRFREHVVQRGVPGNIVMLGSMYGMVASYPDAYADVCAASSVAYHTLKGGVLHMTRHLAIYWADDQVRVNCLSPGPFPNENAPQEMVARLCSKSPMKRMGAPHELKGAVLFLASDASSYVTGQNLVVDGGWTSW